MVDGQGSWRPQNPPLRPLRVIGAWIASAIAVYVAAWLSPGVLIDSTWSAFLVAAFIAIVNAIVPPVVAVAAFALHAAARIRPRACRRSVRADGRRRRPAGQHLGQLVRRRPPCRARDRGRLDRAARDHGHERRRHLHASGRAAHRPPSRRRGPHRRRRHRLPRDRRARAAGPHPCDARRQGPDDGALGTGRGLPPRRVGARPVVADGREPGRDPVGIQRGHTGLPVGGEGDGDADDLLGSGRLRGDRATPRERRADCSQTAARAAATCSRARPTR